MLLAFPMRHLSTRLAFSWRAWRYRLRLDPAEIRYLLAHVAPGDRVVDIGAHKGGYTYWLHRAVGPSGMVFAFEPQPAVARQLGQCLAASGIRNVTLENLALSDHCGEVRMSLPSGSSTCGATLEPRKSVRASFMVRAVTLDQYFDAVPGVRVAFVKCDVEGHELGVLRGADRLLRAHRPTLLLECEARHTATGSVWDVFRHLESLRYTGWFFRKDVLTAIAEFTPETHQAAPGQKPYINNFVFTPRP